MREKTDISDYLLAGYLFFLLVINYIVFSQLNYFQLFVNAYSETLFYKIQLVDFCSLSSFFTVVSIPNLIFNGLMVLSFGNYAFASCFTCTIIFLIILLLIYKIASIDKPKIFALWAVFIFSTLPIIIENSKVSDWHFFETMYVLLLIYLYIKSEDFTRSWYSICYLVVLVDALSGQLSIFLYVLILITLNVYFLCRSRKIFKLRYGMYAVLCILLLYFFNRPGVIPLWYLKRYCCAKLPAWMFLGHFDSQLFVAVFLKLVSGLYTYLSAGYFVLLVSVFLIDMIFFRNKVGSKVDRIVVFFIFVPLVVHFFSSFPAYGVLAETKIIESTHLYDVIPVFVFIVLKFSSVLSWISDFIQLKVNLFKRNVFLRKLLATMFGGGLLMYGLFGVTYFNITRGEIKYAFPIYRVSLSVPWLLTETNLAEDRLYSDMLAYLDFQIRLKNDQPIIVVVDGNTKYDNYLVTSFFLMKRLKCLYVFEDNANEINNLKKVNVFVIKNVNETKQIKKKIFSMIKKERIFVALRKTFRFNPKYGIGERYRVYW